MNTARASHANEKKKRHVVVVGAGAAGLTAAIRAGEGGARVTLLNAHPKVGLKILMSGGTRCNVTHATVDARDYNGGSRPFVARILRAFTPEQTLEWMKSIGVELKLEQTGKYFPVSDDAQTVLDALLAAAERAGVTVRSGARAVKIERAEHHWRLVVQTIHDSAAFSSESKAPGETHWTLPETDAGEWIDADAIVLASGGLSFPRTGSDGTGYALAMSLGHTIVSPVPALTPLTSSDTMCAECQGVALPAELALWVAGKRVETVSGPLLFTHFGYSGPAALDLSRHWLRAEGERRVTANFVPGMNAQMLTNEWTKVGVAEPKTTVRKFLGRHLPDRIAVTLATECEVEPAKWMSQVDRARRQKLIERVTERELPISGTLGYEKAEVTAGGVTLSEVDPSTLESRKAPGVFLCGEILDVEGRLGGFNFQWAWSSGTVVGRSVGR
jgi:predicted flavoprotein YhiN